MDRLAFQLIYQITMERGRRAAKERGHLTKRMQKRMGSTSMYERNQVWATGGCDNRCVFTLHVRIHLPFPPAIVAPPSLVWILKCIPIRSSVFLNLVCFPTQFIYMFGLRNLPLFHTMPDSSINPFKCFRIWKWGMRHPR